MICSRRKECRDEVESSHYGSVRGAQRHVTNDSKQTVLPGGAYCLQSLYGCPYPLRSSATITPGQAASRPTPGCSPSKLLSGPSGSHTLALSPGRACQQPWASACDSGWKHVACPLHKRLQRAARQYAPVPIIPGAPEFPPGPPLDRLGSPLLKRWREGDLLQQAISSILLASIHPAQPGYVCLLVFKF